jgi:hypothetical protein
MDPRNRNVCQSKEHENNKPKPRNCVIEKPKRRKKEPIDQLIINMERQVKDPPPMYSKMLFPEERKKNLRKW